MLSPVELMADKKKTCSDKQVSNQVECVWCRVPPGETLAGFSVPHAYISTKVASIAPPHRGIHHAIIGIWTVKECTLSIALPARYAIQLKSDFSKLGRLSKKALFFRLKQWQEQRNHTGHQHAVRQDRHQLAGKVDSDYQEQQHTSTDPAQLCHYR